MHIALIAHDNKKELLEAFCIAYKGILEKHELYAEAAAGAMLTRLTGLPINLFDFGVLGEEQIAARIAYNEIDLLIMFRDVETNEAMMERFERLAVSCDRNNIPFATNIATAEILVLGLESGDFAWRKNVNPKYSD